MLRFLTWFQVERHVHSSIPCMLYVLSIPSTLSLPPLKFVAAMLPLRFARNSKLRNLGSFQWLGVHIKIRQTCPAVVALQQVDGWIDGRKDRPPNKCMYSFYSFLACSEKNAYDEQKCLTPKPLQQR